MHAISTIADHEFRSIFRSIYGWVALALITGICGSFLYRICLSYLDVAEQNPDHELSVMAIVGQNVIGSLDRLLLFLTPLLTAGSISAERRQQTLLLLQSAPISSWDILLGKFLAYFRFYALIIAVTVVMVIGLRIFNPLDFGHLIAIMIGMTLTSATYVAIGMYCSSLSSSYFTSAVICLIVLLLLAFVLGALAQEYTWLEWLILTSHSREFYAGEVDTRHVGYFVLTTTAFLFLAYQKLEKIRISG